MNAYEDPYLIISSDCHAGLPTERYRPYLDSRFHPRFDEFLGQRDARREEATRLGVRNEAFAQKWFHDHEEGLKGGWDAGQRLKELDGDGVAAEVVFPDADAVDSQTAAPFGVGLGLSGDQDPELGMAGAQAHNRWLAEFVSQNPERHCGVALLPVTAEPAKVVAEVHRAKESGLGALMIPSMWVDKAPYHDRRYDPVWAAAAETAMPIVTHSGAAPRHEYGNHLGIYVSEVTWWPARPLWFLLWSGVFERHPGLRFGIAESGCWWLPNQLWFMDRLYLGAHGGKKLSPFAELKRPPSEYLDRQVFICATNTKRRELAQRYEIGVDNILWGSDFPHPEGTWPDTRNWLRNTFHDIPVAETRRMLGLAAAEVFGFDTAKLAPVARRIGPTPDGLGQSPDQAAVEASWARSRETGRHWLTGGDFPVLGGLLMAGDRYTVVSADCHAGADLPDYRPYLAKRHHDAFDAWAAGYVNPYEDLLADTADRNWNSARRLAELEADGIVAEVLFPNTIPPFFPAASLMTQPPTAAEYELRWAGLQAHNRWLADFCADAPGRRAGVAQILLNDVDEAVREIRRTREAGLTGGILLPGVPPGSPVPELYSAVYDPIWAVCAELDVPVNHHGGSASPPLGDEPAARAVFMVETTWFSHRALWHLIFGGAFRRHPGLKLVLTEQGSGWIPGVLEMLDYYHGRLVTASATAEAKFGAGLADGMGRGPSEVWRDNCFVGASFMRPHEVPLRDRIGLDKIMWGSDYPHDEGTTPFSREGLRIAYAGLPREEVAAMVGGNAARVYGFDLPLLDALAAEHGPLVSEIAEPLTHIPAEATSPAFARGASVRVW